MIVPSIVDATLDGNAADEDDRNEIFICKLDNSKVRAC